MSTPQLPLKIASSRWPLGSEWRRWDLHVHTPESRLGSSFRGVTWEQYVTAIETSAIKARISVIGVTDYMTLDGYEKLFAEKNANARLETIDLLIPNIEFRMMPQTSDGKALNIHLLIDPSDANHIDKIKGALRNLKFSYSGQYYGCCRDELIAFGRAQDPQLTDDEAAYRSGINQFKPDMTVIKKWLDNEQWLKKNSLVGIANGKDGISGLPLDGFGATRQEILKWSDFVFSGNPRDREHYLGLKPMISKIFYKTSANDTVKGFDAVHVVGPPEDMELWIGEAKFYKNIAAAIRDVVTEIIAHIQRDYLREEFLWIKGKIDNASAHAEQMNKLLSPNTSLDAIFKRTCIPVLVEPTIVLAS